MEEKQMKEGLIYYRWEKQAAHKRLQELSTSLASTYPLNSSASLTPIVAGKHKELLEKLQEAYKRVEFLETLEFTATLEFNKTFNKQEIKDIQKGLYSICKNVKQLKVGGIIQTPCHIEKFTVQCTQGYLSFISASPKTSFCTQGQVTVFDYDHNANKMYHNHCIAYNNDPYVSVIERTPEELNNIYNTEIKKVSKLVIDSEQEK